MIVPRYIQDEDFSCGPASLKVIYSCLGVEVPEKQICEETGLTPEGASWEQLVQNAPLHGFDAEFKKEAEIGDLTAKDDEGVIICYQTLDAAGEEGHFCPVALVGKETIILSDVAWGNYVKYSLFDFLEKWRDMEGERNLLKIKKRK